MRTWFSGLKDDGLQIGKESISFYDKIPWRILREKLLSRGKRERTVSPPLAHTYTKMEEEKKKTYGKFENDRFSDNPLKENMEKEGLELEEEETWREHIGGQRSLGQGNQTCLVESEI